MITLYKPNKNITGAIASFRVVKSDKDVSVMVNLVRQSGWDEKNRAASFKWPEANRKENTKNVKLNVFELGTLIHGFSNYLEGLDKNEISLFHKFNDVTTSIWVARHKSGNNNFIFSVSEGSNKFVFGLTAGEAMNLVELFKIAIQESIFAEEEKAKSRFEEYSKKSGGGPSKKSESQNKASNEEENEEGSEDDTDIPF